MDIDDVLNRLYRISNFYLLDYKKFENVVNKTNTLINYIEYNMKNFIDIQRKAVQEIMKFVDFLEKDMVNHINLAKKVMKNEL